MADALARDTDLNACTDWTSSSLRDFFLSLLSASDRRYEERYRAQEKAVELAFSNLTDKLDNFIAVSKEEHVAVDFRSQHRHETAMSQVMASRNEWVLTSTALKESLSVALLVQTQAVAKAEVNNEKRFDGVNEFRAALSDQQRTLMPRLEVDVIVKGLMERIEQANAALRDVNLRLIAVSGERSGIHQGWGYAVGAVGLLLSLTSLIGFFVTKLIKP